MAFAIDTYTGNGNTTSFSITFPYIEQAHVIVTVDGVTKTLTTHYTFSNSSTISFGTAPAASTIIKITRSSNRSARLVDYQDGSTLTEATLDQDANQAFFMAQEAIDTGGMLNYKQEDIFNKQSENPDESGLADTLGQETVSLPQGTDTQIIIELIKEKAPVTRQRF